MAERERTPEQIEADIESSLRSLYENYAEFYDEMGEELQGRWYDAEMEAKVGKDRELGFKHLQEFIWALDDWKDKKGS